MNKTLEGMARAAIERNGYDEFDALTPWSQEAYILDQKAALLWLADNVSDEMVYAYLFAPNISGKNVDENVRKSISAALRAAGDGR